MNMFEVKATAFHRATGKPFTATFAAAATSSAEAVSSVYDAYDWSGCQQVRLTAKRLAPQTWLLTTTGPLPVRRA